MLAPFEIVGHRVQATAGHGALSFDRVLALADADPFCPLRQTVDYALSPDEAKVPVEQWQGRVVLLGINNMATGYGGRLRLAGRIMGRKRNARTWRRCPPRRIRARPAAVPWKAPICSCSAGNIGSFSAR